MNLISRIARKFIKYVGTIVWGIIFLKLLKPEGNNLALVSVVDIRDVL